MGGGEGLDLGGGPWDDLRDFLGKLIVGIALEFGGNLPTADPSNDPLEELLGIPDAQPSSAGGAPPEVAPSGAPPKTNGHDTWPSGAARGVQKVSYTHDGMIDLIIANPAILQNDLARQFGYSPSWVCQIIASDSFQARLAERTKELVDPTIRLTIEERFKALILRSLEILKEKLDRPTGDIPDNLALRTFELASRAAGYGARVEQTNVQVNLETHLDDMGDRLTKLLVRKKSEIGGNQEPPAAPPLEHDPQVDHGKA